MTYYVCIAVGIKFGTFEIVKTGGHCIPLGFIVCIGYCNVTVKEVVWYHLYVFVVSKFQ